MNGYEAICIYVGLFGRNYVCMRLSIRKNTYKWKNEEKIERKPKYKISS